MRSFFSIKYAAFVVLLLLNAYIWVSYFHVPTPELKISFLDVGQGDSIFIEGPTGIQMLIDGGPDRSVVRQLPKEMGFFDRSIDIVVETHPDKDHIAGLTDVFGRYGISYFLSPGIPGDTATAAGLTNAVNTEKNIQAFIARQGMRIHLGGGAYADVLYPDRDVSQGASNDGSVIMRMVYGDTSFMLTGDAPSTVEDQLVSADVKSTVLKAGHHGSRSSTSEVWLTAVDPDFVIISAGENNSYGHPHDEVVGRVKDSGAKLVSTIESGTLRFVSDGNVVRLK